jgi:hypothetical protein
VNYKIIAIYRSPSIYNITAFLNDLGEMLSTQSHGNSIIVGDLNINTMQASQHRQLEEYENLTSQFGYTHCITRPTRVSENSSSCIDHILVNFSKEVVPIVFQNTITDHYATILGIKHDLIRSKGEVESSFYETVDHTRLAILLREECWDSISSLADVNIAYDSFVDKIERNISKCKRIVKISHSRRRIKPWITGGLVRSIRRRDKLHRQSRNNPGNNSLSAYYRRYRNILTRLIDAAKICYYSRKLSQSNDTKSTWKTIRGIVDENRAREPVKELQLGSRVLNTNDNAKEIADAFNSFFHEIGSNLAGEILERMSVSEDELIQNIGIDNTGPSLFLTPVTEGEVVRIISKLKNDCAPGPDNLKVSFFKRNKDTLCKPLASLINLCYETGTFPHRLKEAEICPVFKAGERTDVNCYRPISILNVASKIFESSVKTRLVSFFDKHNTLSANQYGFRSDLSTNSALLEVIRIIMGGIDSDRKVLAIFLDLKKAFDTVSHKILLKRLHEHGVRGIAWKLFESYLSCRIQRVRINKVKSNNLIIDYGIPQGTVLGPILFLLYINKLCKLRFNGEIVAFADDTVLLFTGSDWEDSREKAELGIRMVKEWLDNNLLTLNYQKTYFLSFSPSAQGQPAYQQLAVGTCSEHVGCNCRTIQRQHSLKYLGIQVDSLLRWEEHIKGLCQRLRRLVYTFIKLRDVLDRKTLKTVYFSIVQSVLSYGIVGWGGTYYTYLDPLIKVQKLILRVMGRKHPRYASEQLFGDFQVLDIRQLYTREILLLAQRDKGKYPVQTHLYGTRNRHLIPLHRARVTLYQRHFCYLAPKVYNLLPTHVKDLPHGARFKREAHKWLMAMGRERTETIISTICL